MFFLEVVILVALGAVDKETGGKLDESTKIGNQIYNREREDDLVIDMPTEKKVEVGMKYLMDAWEHHKVKSGEYQAHINKLVELREMHYTRLRAIQICSSRIPVVRSVSQSFGNSSVVDCGDC